VHLKVSVVIPTYHRLRDLELCFDSILAQTITPVEVVVIDNDPAKTTEPLVRQYQKAFGERRIALYYVGNRRNSLTAARNMAVGMSCGDVVLFLDDDVVLEKDYLHGIIDVFERNRNALGVQGHIVSQKNKRVIGFFRRLLFLFHLERERCRVLPSINPTYPLTLEKITPCEWLRGCNAAYQRHVLAKFQHDERLTKYSHGEDLDHSYRIFKQYPGSLFITPFARLVHKVSSESRAPGREVVYMREIYGLYLFYRLFAPTPKNKIIYLWSRLGQLVFALAKLVVRRSPEAMSGLWYLLGAYCLTLRYVERIKRGDLEFFNCTLET
jgi:GT2 family glycosyltransferase